MTYEKELGQLRARGVRVQMVRTFAELDRIASEFTVGHNGFKTPFLIVVGQHGTSKSYHFESIEGARYINNAASPVGLYSAVYWCRQDHANEDMPIILDDVDGLLEEKGATALFKALGSDREQKHLSWEKQNTWLESLGVPNSYTTSSRLCILCNSLPKVRRDLQAVFDRAKIVVFSPSAQEIHRYVGTWWPAEHTDIYDYLGANLTRIYEPSIRWYTDTKREKLLGNNWRDWLLATWFDEQPQLQVVAELRQKMAGDTFNQQAAEFEKITGLKRASYNLYLQKWKQSQGMGEG
ncbi:MAG TPA: hypothetical protein VF598_01785 [Hymenobacter sp.]|jgi:hypothetical protein